jgi:anti-anti-sigma factor
LIGLNVSKLKMDRGLSRGDEVVEPITERVDSNVLIIRVDDKSRLNESRPEDFRRKLNEILQSHPEVRGVILDISSVDFFSSTAIATLVLLKRGVSAKSGRLIITGMHPDVRNALEIVKLSNHFENATDIDAALEMFGPA